MTTVPGASGGPSARARLSAVRSRLALPLVRRATGLLEGQHRSVYRGHGQDFDDLRVYQPGDDVGDIDWRASARTGSPVVKRYVATSNVAVVLVVDTGRHMSATAARGEDKGEVAQYVATIVATVAQQRGDRLGLVAGDAGRVVHLPARGGRTQLEVLVRQLVRTFDPAAPPGDLPRLLDRAMRQTVQRSLVVVVTDEARPGEGERAALARLRTRHAVLVVQVADADAFALDVAGGPPGRIVGSSSAHERGRPTRAVRGTVTDADSGAVVPGLLRGRRRAVEAAHRARVARHDRTVATMAGLGIPSVVVEGTHDALDEFVALLERHRRAGR
jgi:uncharacterized protein (DUF58 family)